MTNCLEISIETLDPSGNFFAKMVSLEFVSFDRLIRSGWNVPRFLYINSCFQSHTHTRRSNQNFVRNLNGILQRDRRKISLDRVMSFHFSLVSCTGRSRTNGKHPSRTRYCGHFCSATCPPPQFYFSLLYSSFLNSIYSLLIFSLILLFCLLYYLWLSKKRQTNKLLGLLEIRLLRQKVKSLIVMK